MERFASEQIIDQKKEVAIRIAEGGSKGGGLEVLGGTPSPSVAPRTQQPSTE